METTSIPEPQPPRKRHSVFGLISCGMGVVSLIATGIGLAGIIYLNEVHHGQVDLSPYDTTLAALCMVTSGPLALLGISGGAIGFIETNRRRLFAWLGIALNVLALIALAALIVLIASGHGPQALPPNI